MFFSTPIGSDIDYYMKYQTLTKPVHPVQPMQQHYRSDVLPALPVPAPACSPEAPRCPGLLCHALSPAAADMFLIRTTDFKEESCFLFFPFRRFFKDSKLFSVKYSQSPISRHFPHLTIFLCHLTTSCLAETSGTYFHYFHLSPSRFPHSFCFFFSHVALESYKMLQCTGCTVNIPMFFPSTLIQILLF